MTAGHCIPRSLGNCNGVQKIGDTSHLIAINTITAERMWSKIHSHSEFHILKPPAVLDSTVFCRAPMWRLHKHRLQTYGNPPYRHESFPPHTSDKMGSLFPGGAERIWLSRRGAKGVWLPGRRDTRGSLRGEMKSRRGFCLHSSLWTQLKWELCFAGDYHVVTGSPDSISSKV